MTIVWLENKCFFPLTRGGGKKNLNFGLHGSVIDGLLAGLISRIKCAHFGRKGSVFYWFSRLISEALGDKHMVLNQ